MKSYTVTARSFIAGSIREPGSIVREDEFTGPAPAHFRLIETSTSEESAPDASEDQLPNVTVGAMELAESSGIDITTVQGTGKGGTVTKADVQAAIEDASE